MQLATSRWVANPRSSPYQYRHQYPTALPCLSPRCCRIPVPFPARGTGKQSNHHNTSPQSHSFLHTSTAARQVQRPAQIHTYCTIPVPIAVSNLCSWYLPKQRFVIRVCQCYMRYTRRHLRDYISKSRTTYLTCTATPSMCT